MLRIGSIIIFTLMVVFFAASPVFASQSPASLKKDYPDKKQLGKKNNEKPKPKSVSKPAAHNPPKAKPASMQRAVTPKVQTKDKVPVQTRPISEVTGGRSSVFDVAPKSTATKAAAKPAPKAQAPKSEPKKTVAAKKTSSPPKKLPPEKIKKPIIVIDAGHGGKDPGAIGKAGTYEKRLTLDYALTLTKELEKGGKYKVVLTRNRDIYLTLNERVQKARAAKGDIFISLHADSINNPMTRGFSVYTLSGDRAARVANRMIQNAEKRDEVMGINMKGQKSDVKQALVYMAKVDTQDNSAMFSSLLARKLGQKVKPLEKTRREASLQVLTATEIPSVLIELGYLSNTMEEKLLQNKNHKAKIVKGIKDAIDEYFHK